MSDPTAQMRNVLDHVRTKIAATRQPVESQTFHSAKDVQLISTLAYTQGVLDLLVAYLRVEDAAGSETESAVGESAAT